MVVKLSQNMSKYEIRSYFKRWLSRHIELLPYRPFLCRETDSGDLYRFQGVTPLLSLWVDSYFQSLLDL